MIPLWAALAAGAGAGLVKSEFVDKPNEKKDRINAATTMRYSPWTGMKPEQVERASALASALQGGAQGAALGQSLGKYEGDMKLQEGLAKILTPAEQGASMAPAAVQVSDIGPETYSAMEPGEAPVIKQDVIEQLRQALGLRKAGGY